MKKTILFLAVFIVLAALITGCANKTEPKVIGGDKDAGGCLVGAGYSWCDAKQKCIRVWEEPCKTADELSACTNDSDCIPLPSECHPMSCINKKFEGNYVKPEMCTMMFAVEAAYNPEDCACVANKCVDKNLGKSAEVPQGKISPDAVIDSYGGCVAAGGPVMESYPRQCSYQGKTYTEKLSDNKAEVHVCTAEESQQTACTLEYMPVCGKIVLNMGDTKYQTFGNKCSACAAMKVVSYVPGECANSSVG